VKLLQPDYKICEE
jgi:hypothetical protein